MGYTNNILQFLLIFDKYFHETNPVTTFHEGQLVGYPFHLTISTQSFSSSFSFVFIHQIIMTGTKMITKKFEGLVFPELVGLALQKPWGIHQKKLSLTYRKLCATSTVTSWIMDGMEHRRRTRNVNETLELEE
jgi:hypothetical protein